METGRIWLDYRTTGAVPVAHHGIHTGLQRIMVAERDRRGRVVAIEDCQPAERSQDAEGLGEDAIGTGHVAQGRVEDDDIEGFILERKRLTVDLLGGDVR